MPILTIGTGSTLVQPRPPVVSTLPVPTNSLVVGVGDSITVACHNSAPGAITRDFQFQPRLQNPSGATGGYLTWAAMLPKTGDSFGNGRFRFNGVHATTNMRTDAIKTTHIDGVSSPLNDDPKPGIVVVLGGSNDLAVISNNTNIVLQAELDFTIGNLEAIYDALIAAGILPVACQVPPTNNANYQLACIALNEAIVDLAASKGLVCADLFTPTRAVPGSTTNATWASGHTVEGIHPSVLGARAMGQALRDAIDPVLYAGLPNLVTDATDGDADLVLKNGAFERDGSVAGLPAGGGSGTETTSFFSLVANGATPTLAARAGYSGRALIMDKTTDPGTTTLTSTGSATLDIDLVDGHTYDFGFVAEIESWSGTGTQYLFQINKVTDGNKVPFRLTLAKDANFSGAIAPFAMLRTFRCSDSAVGTPIPSGGYRFTVTWGAAATDNLIKTGWGQMTIRDLGVI